MARRNLMRAGLAASLLAVSGAAGGLGVPAPAGAGHIRADHVVIVHETHFAPDVVYADRRETIEFRLAPGVGTDHTVTLEAASCQGRPVRLCERRFDDPNVHQVVFEFSEYDDYLFYDRYARRAGREMTGKFVISAAKPPPPATTSTTTAPPPATTSTTTAPPPTTTTRPPATTTTLAPTAPTTEPGSAAPPPLPPPSPPATATPTTAATPKTPRTTGSKGRSTSKNKGKAAAGTATTVAPAVPDEEIFDAESLTPGPTTLPDTLGRPVDPADAAAVDASAVLSLLEPGGADDDRTGLVLMALGGAGLASLGVGIWRWYHRSSRYLPA